MGEGEAGGVPVGVGVGESEGEGEGEGEGEQLGEPLSVPPNVLGDGQGDPTTTRTRLSPPVATYRVPLRARPPTATAWGLVTRATTAGPPSPLKPATPSPRTV